MCRSCRNKQREPAPGGHMRTKKQCPQCGKAFIPTGFKQVCCSRRCGQQRRGQRVLPLPKTRPCPDCGVAVTGFQSSKCCESCIAVRISERWRRKNRLRRGKARPKVVRPITMLELGVRDGWRCHLCRKRVNRRLFSPHPMSPTADHLIPVKDGGSDDAENLRLAHRVCNTRRGTRGVVQLLLVG